MRLGVVDTPRESLRGLIHYFRELVDVHASLLELEVGYFCVGCLIDPPLCDPALWLLEGPLPRPLPLLRLAR